MALYKKNMSLDEGVYPARPEGDATDAAGPDPSMYEPFSRAARRSSGKVTGFSSAQPARPFARHRQTGSRARRSGDSALAEGKNAAVVGKWTDYSYIPAELAEAVNAFNRERLSPF